MARYLVRSDLYDIEAQLDYLIRIGRNIMSAISDFAIAQNGYNDQMDAAIAALQGDIKALNDQITALQNSPGAVTPQDQALLDGLQTRGKNIADKLDALDALTPPVPPVGG